MAIILPINHDKRPEIACLKRFQADLLLRWHGNERENDFILPQRFLKAMNPGTYATGQPDNGQGDSSSLQAIFDQVMRMSAEQRQQALKEAAGKVWLEGSSNLNELRQARLGEEDSVTMKD